jgi:hypothetical protein
MKELVRRIVILCMLLYNGKNVVLERDIGVIWVEMKQGILKTCSGEDILIDNDSIGMVKTESAPRECGE